MPLGNIPLLNIAPCTVDDVASLIDVKLQGFDLQNIALLINEFAKLLEIYTKRSLHKQKYTEVFNGGKTHVIVSAPPIVVNANLEVWEDPSSEFADSKYKLIINKDFIVTSQTGFIQRIASGISYRYWYFIPYAQCVKVVYNGGIINNDETQEGSPLDSPADLRGACAMQVSYWFSNRKNFGLQAVSQMGSNLAQYFGKPTDLLPGVQRVVLSYMHHEI